MNSQSPTTFTLWESETAMYGYTNVYTALTGSSHIELRAKLHVSCPLSTHEELFSGRSDSPLEGCGILVGAYIAKAEEIVPLLAKCVCVCVCVCAIKLILHNEWYSYEIITVWEITSAKITQYVTKYSNDDAMYIKCL